jgi:NitT/TauT family transport system permease protein/putative hydroxymethylpyrimidine transport system permease protein
MTSASDILTETRGPRPVPATPAAGDATQLHDLKDATNDRHRWSRLLHLIGPGLVIATVLAAWQMITSLGWIKQFVLPSPSAIISAISAAPGLFAGNTVRTAEEALLALVFGTAAGVLTAVGFVYSSFVRRSFYPLALAAQSIPVIAIAPLLAIWLGPGMLSKILVAGFLCYFPTLVSVQRGLRAVDPETMELMRSYNASWWRVLTRVRIPCALPYLFVALRISAGGCFVGALTAEWIGADRGLGYLISVLGAQFEIPQLWGAALIASMLAVTAFGLVGVVEYFAMPWRRGASRDA